MVWRNSLLIGALIAGVAILVLMYVRRGFSDLQGQIDDIETVLAAMPPALTSGQFNTANALFNPVAQPPVTDGAGGQLGAGTGTGEGIYNTDEQEEALEYDDYNPLHSEALHAAAPAAMDDISEYSLDERNIGVASLVEPGVYQSGVVELTVMADGDVEDDDAPGSQTAIEEIDAVEDDLGPTECSGDEMGGDQEDDAVNAVLEATAGHTDIQSTPLANLGDVTGVVGESAGGAVGDEFDILTLPELKARLKATQPHVKAIGRMKRAEVLDRLRSNPEVGDADEN